MTKMFRFVLFVWSFMLYRQLFNNDTPQIHCSWTILNQYLTSPLSWHWLASHRTIPKILIAKAESHVLLQVLKTLVCWGQGSNPQPPTHKADALTTKAVYLDSTLSLVLTSLQYKVFENTVGKVGIAHNKQFLLFPQCFLPFVRAVFYFHQIWNCCLQTLSLWKIKKNSDWEKVKKRVHIKILTARYM